MFFVMIFLCVAELPTRQITVPANAIRSRAKVGEVASTTLKVCQLLLVGEVLSLEIFMIT